MAVSPDPEDWEQGQDKEAKSFLPDGGVYSHNDDIGLNCMGVN